MNPFLHEARSRFLSVCMIIINIFTKAASRLMLVEERSQI